MTIREQLADYAAGLASTPLAGTNWACSDAAATMGFRWTRRRCYLWGAVLRDVAIPPFEADSLAWSEYWAEIEARLRAGE